MSIWISKSWNPPGFPISPHLGRQMPSRIVHYSGTTSSLYLRQTWKSLNLHLAQILPRLNDRTRIRMCACLNRDYSPFANIRCSWIASVWPTHKCAIKGRGMLTWMGIYRLSKRRCLWGFPFQTEGTILRGEQKDRWKLEEAGPCLGIETWNRKETCQQRCWA